jgi:hypothetical protein
MGAWSPLPFGNDDASEWLSEFVGDARPKRIGIALKAVLTRGEAYLEAPAASRAIAACEVVAKLGGRSTQQDATTQQLDKWVKSSGMLPSAVLLGAARRTLDRVRGPNSELADLWAQSGEIDAWHRALDQLNSALALPANIEPVRNRVLMLVAPFAVLTCVIMYLFFDQRGWVLRDVAFEALMVTVALLVTLGAISSRRFWWATRLLAFLIFLAYAGVVVDQGFFEPNKSDRWLGASNSLSALLGFCFYGIPAVLYTFSGSTYGPIARRSEIAEVKQSDRNYFLLARLARWFCIGGIAILVAARLVKLIASSSS